MNAFPACQQDWVFENFPEQMMGGLGLHEERLVVVIGATLCLPLRGKPVDEGMELSVKVDLNPRFLESRFYSAIF